jgi:archaellum component FlaC
MEINIKNARRLESEIDTEIARLKGRLRVSAGKYNTVADSIELTKEHIDTTLGKVSALLGIRKDIRDKIGKFNVENGINDTTSEIAIKSAELEMLELAYDFDDPRKPQSYGITEELYKPGLNEANRDFYYAKGLKLKRSIQRLKDRCMGINASGKIELDSDTESFLKISGLMD